MPTQTQTLVKNYLKSFFAFQPTAATDAGFAGFDDQLPDFSPGRVAEFLKELASLTAEIADTQDIDADLLMRKIAMQNFTYTSQNHHILNPSLYVSLVSNSLFGLMMGTHRADAEKIHGLTGRLKKIPDFLEGAKKILDKPVTLWTKLALAEIPGTVEYITQTVLPYLTQNKVLGADKITELARLALFDFAAYLENLKNTRDDFAIGRDQFEYVLKTFHGLNYSAEDIKRIGYEQIDDINSELSRKADIIDDNMTWQELVAHLKNNHPKADSLLHAYQNKVAELKKFLVDKKLVTLPAKESLDVIDTPAFMREHIPYAAYSAPTMFASDDRGLFFVTPSQGNLDVLKEHCFASFPLTALHEAYPGHHLQFATQRNLKSDMRKVYDVASYYEGWTLYCEEMMYREGFYDDAMRLYQLKDKLWRACRIVVDVSMQCFGMTDDEAANFLVEQAKLSPQSARIDVNWYTQSPTIPMSYLVGMLEVDKMRVEFVGKGKSLKEFHDAFLSCGAIPLKHVRQLILKES